MEQETIELHEHRAMIYLPENAIALKVSATVYEDGKIADVMKEYNLADIREMFQKADDGYIDDDDTFVLTDKGLEWIENHKG